MDVCQVWGGGYPVELGKVVRREWSGEKRVEEFEFVSRVTHRSARWGEGNVWGVSGHGGDVKWEW